MRKIVKKIVRKRIIILVSLFIVFTLGGCITKNNDTSQKPTLAVSPTFTPTSSPKTAPVAEQPELSKEEQPSPASFQERALAREIVEIKNGDSFDFDGDGNVEQIRIVNSSNHADDTLSIGNATYPIGLLGGDKPYISHMTEYDGDKDLQILFDGLGQDVDEQANIFHYEEGEIYYLGSVGGLVRDIKSLGNGLYETRERAKTLQTWFHPRKFYITGSSYLSYNDDSTTKMQRALVRMPNEMYPVGTRVILKCDITLLQMQQSNSEEIQLKKGQFGTIVASDDEEWLFLQSDEGQSGWIRIKDVGDFFEGLCNAD